MKIFQYIDYSPLFLKNSEILFTVQNSYLLLCQLLVLLACFLRHQRELQIRLVYSVGYCVPHGFLGDLLGVSLRPELFCLRIGYCGFPYLKIKLFIIIFFHCHPTQVWIRVNLGGQKSITTRLRNVCTLRTRISVQYGIIV